MTAIARVVTKAGGQMLIAKLEDQTGAIEVVVFPKWYPELSPLFADDAIVVVKGKHQGAPRDRQAARLIEPQSARRSEDEERPEVSLQAIEAWPLGQAPVISGGSRAVPQ